MPILVLLLSLSTAFAATKASDLKAIWKRGELAPKCDELTTKYQDYLGSEAKSVMPAEVTMQALITLESLRPANPAEIKKIRRALEDDFAASLLYSFPVFASDCAQVRVSLGRALIDAAVADPALKAKVKDRFTAVMKQPRYPHFLEMMIDIVVMEHGVDKGFWTTLPKVATQIHEHRAKMKQDSTVWREAYESTMAKAKIGELPPTDEAIAQLKKSSDLPKIKAAILGEQDVATKNLKINAEIMGQLK